MVKLKLMKRVDKEVKLLEDYYESDKVEVRTVFVNEQDPYVINLYKNKNLFCNVKIILPYDYPFKNPGFYFYSINDNIISTINYFDFFKNCSYFYFYKNQVVLDEHLCPCCYNTMCNRELNQSLLELSKDIQKFSIQFMRLREKYFAKKYINILNNLNEDILNILLEYI